MVSNPMWNFPSSFVKEKYELRKKTGKIIPYVEEKRNEWVSTINEISKILKREWNKIEEILKNSEKKISNIGDSTKEIREILAKLSVLEENINSEYSGLFEKIKEELDKIDESWNKISESNWKIFKILEDLKNKIKFPVSRVVKVVCCFFKKVAKDQLTKLYSATYINGLIEKLFWKEDFYLLFIDINDLKKVNDMYWHEKWNELIIAFSKALKNIFKWPDFVVARVHGDEFMIIWRNSSNTAEEELKKKLIELEKTAVIPNFVKEGEKYIIGFGAWYAFSNDYNDMSALKKAADEAMYVDKNKKKGMN